MEKKTFKPLSCTSVFAAVGWMFGWSRGRKLQCRCQGSAHHHWSGTLIGDWEWNGGTVEAPAAERGAGRGLLLSCAWDFFFLLL